MWPDTEAIVVAPLAAHGLFTRPLVVGRSACVEIVVTDDLCGRRQSVVRWTSAHDCSSGRGVVRARVSSSPVQLVRIDDTPFSRASCS